MDRRQFLKAGLVSPFAFGQPSFARGPTFIGDMHFHLFFFGRRPAYSWPLARDMAAGNATLVAWSLVGDVPWLRQTRRGLRQGGVPAQGEALDWFREELARIKAYLERQNLKIVRTSDDLSLALNGDPHVVLAVEGASFADEDLGQLRTAYESGVRHIQLVHYIRNRIGDFQTERPEHNGLTEFGKRVVRECNRLGILVDLAHCTDAVVGDALAVSKAPMVWSHSSVTRTHQPHWSMPTLRARQLSIQLAEAIAAKGGVVGLWGLRSDIGDTIGAYADRLSELADWLGEDHAAFGTDMNGLANPVIGSFADLRGVVDHWERRKMSATRVRKLAIENYARVLRQAFEARQA